MDKAAGCISLETLNEEVILAPHEYCKILELQQNIFELLSVGHNQQAVLGRLCQLAEKTLPNSVASIMLLDSQTGLMSVVSAPSIPDVGHKALEGLKPGPGGGSCGNAVFRNEAQFVTDTKTDERWADIRQIAFDFNLCSCWSMPIQNSQNQPIGSFALSSFEHRSPSNFHKKLLKICAFIVNIVLKRSEYEAQINENQHRIEISENLLRNLIDEMPDVFVLKDHKGDFLLCNQAVANLYNTTPEEMIGKNDEDFGVPHELSEFFRQNVLSIMESGETQVVYEDSRNAITGEIHNFRSIKKPFKDINGNNQILVIAQDITDLIQANEKVIHNEKRLREVFEATQEGIWDWSLDDNSVIHNDQWYKLLGYNEGEIADNVEAFSAHIHPDDQALVWGNIQKLLNAETNIYYSEHRMITKNGGVIWVQDRGKIVEFDEMGSPKRVVGSFADITKRKTYEEQLTIAANVFTHANEGIVITLPDGTIIDMNDAFSRITGYERDEAIGSNPRILNSKLQGEVFYSNMWQDLIDKGHWNGELWNRRKDGEVYAEMLNISSIVDLDGNTQYYVALFSDITSQKKHEQQLEHIAHYDALTGLPNRVLKSDRLRQAMIHAERRNEKIAVVYLDLDGFKQVNDRYGHLIGDQFLIALSARMKQALREGDTLSRLGGDEFVAILVDMDDADSALPIIQRLLDAASQSIEFENIVVQVSASIGVTFYPQHEDVDADQLIRQADQAMYNAKQSGKNRYHVFDPEHDRSIRIRHEYLERIEKALDNDEFVLFYQPKVNMRTSELIGVEALIRWQHPEQGLIPPLEFLPIIENHPLSVKVGEWVINKAISQIKQWQMQGLNLLVSVNVGAKQLLQGNFVKRLQWTLSQHENFDPSSLIIEVLETSALEDVNLASSIIEECKAMGVYFALDDFGTGYSSLTYLKQLPVRSLKIDQSFVRDMLDDRDDLAILEGIIGLAKAFNRKVIAEGVETYEHGKQLLLLGCELAQGYGIARPMPAEKMIEWSQEWQTNHVWVV